MLILFDLRGGIIDCRGGIIGLISLEYAIEPKTLFQPFFNKNVVIYRKMICFQNFFKKYVVTRKNVFVFKKVFNITCSHTHK